MPDYTFAQALSLAAVPLAGAVGAFVASYIVASRNVYINSITVERSKWIEKLRNNLSSFSALVKQAAKLNSVTFGELKPAEGEPALFSDAEYKQLVKEVELAASSLRLQLNPWGVIDGAIAELVEGLSRENIAPGQHLHRGADLLIEHSQWLLKAEWEKVKWEAGGHWYRFKHRKDAEKLLAEYRTWTAAGKRIKPHVALMEQAARKVGAEQRRALLSGRVAPG